MRFLTVLGLLLLLTGFSTDALAGWSKVGGKDKEDMLRDTKPFYEIPECDQWRSC